MFKGLGTYLRTSLADLLRWTWPTLKEVIQATQATLLFFVITALFLFVADLTLGNLIKLLIA